MLKIVEEISKYFELEPYPKFNNCWRSDMETLGGIFITKIFKPLTDGESCIAMTAVDSFDEKLCESVFEIIEESGVDASCVDNAISIIEGLNVKNYPFDSVAITNYESFRMFEAVDKELDRKTCGAVPIARCELTGHETAQEVLAIFARLIKYIDWKRDITPRISMKYRLKTGAARKYKLYDQYALSCVLEELSEKDKYNIEIKNYKEEYIKIDIKDGVYRVFGMNKEAYIHSNSLTEIKQWIQGYLVRGLK